MIGLSLVVLALVVVAEALLIFEAGVEGAVLAFDVFPGFLRFLKRILGTTDGDAAEAGEFAEIGGGGELEMTESAPAAPAAPAPAEETEVDLLELLLLFWDALSALVLILSFIILVQTSRGGRSRC